MAPESTIADTGHRYCTAYVDSGAAQTLFCVSEAFLPQSLRASEVVVEGIGGKCSVRQSGSVRILLRADQGVSIIAIIHNCLLSDGCHNLLSVSQIHDHGHSISLHRHHPQISLRDHSHPVPLRLEADMYELPFQILTANDPRLHTLPTVMINTPGDFTPATHPFRVPALMREK